MPKNISLARKQLDARFQKMRMPDLFVRPSHGWIRAIRDSLGMSTAQMAARLGVSQPRITALEQGEVKGTVTLESLEKAAEALDCTLVYVLLPRQPLQTMVEAQAKKIAEARLKSVGHTMNLEAQGVAPEDAKIQLQELTKDLVRQARRLWNQP